MESENYPVHVEAFDVVLIKKGASSLTAKVGDFKRLTIEASSSLAAQLDDRVSAESEYVPMMAIRPGVMSEPEIMARRRELEGPPVDRSAV
jgi:hypothetical protein